VAGDHVYIQAGAALLKLHQRTGETLWRSMVDEGGMNGSAFSSPYLTTVAGREQLLVQSRTHLNGVDPESGAVLWSQEVPAFRGMNIVTPTVLGDGVFTSSYGGKSFLYRISGSGDGTQSASLAWDNKAQGYMCSPVVIGGHAYLHLRNQRFTCIDLSSGETRWTTTPYGKYWSLVVQGDRILALDETGMLRLIRATPEKFDLLDERQVSDQECWAHLAVAGEDVVVRELKGLAVYRWGR
jgi:outer membrane protein assembly factor BamB